MLTTTLNRIRAHELRKDGWAKLLAHLGKTQADDEPLAYAEILASNGLDDALWCCRCEPLYQRAWRELAWRYATQVRHLMEDKRSTDCLDILRRWLDGQATDDELAAARAAAGYAAWATAGEAAVAAAGAAWAAAWEAKYAARTAARDAAWAAASDAAVAAWTAWAAAKQEQMAEFLRVVSQNE